MPAIPLRRAHSQGTDAMNTVPFLVEDVCAGLARCEGLLRDEGDHLCLEFQVKDSVVGVFGSKIRQTRVPLEDLVSVTLTKGWLSTNLGVKLVLEAASMEALQDVPGMSQGRVSLQIARKDMVDAEHFVDALHRRQAAASPSS
jgi:hypothetical protein